MQSRSQFQTGVAIVIIIWVGLLFISGVTLRPSYLKYLSLAVSLGYFLLVAFDRWLWRIPFVARMFHRPVLYGTWKGQLQSSWTDPSGKEGIPPIAVFLAVRQTNSSISMRMMTKESASRSLVASLEAPRGDVVRASCTYQSDPRLLIQGRSRIHYGALMLEVEGNPATRLTGSYWTDRDTKGEVSLDARVSKSYTSFDEALAAEWP